MMIERLQVYASKNGSKLPERVFVFRDGVSEVCCRIVRQCRSERDLGTIRRCPQGGIAADTGSFQEDS